MSFFFPFFFLGYCSGQELGLVRDRRLLTAGWESGEVDTLFAAIAAGAAIA